MLIHVAQQPIHYDGRQLSSLFGFRNFGLQGDSVICFRGSCQVALTEMVDLADVRQNAPIYSEDMLHFIIEHFDMDLEKTVVRQRLLMAVIKEIIESRTGISLRRKGDDLYRGEGKLSVSIATASPVSTMIHTGLNISSRNTPVQTVGLADLGIPPADSLSLGEIIARAYGAEMTGIRLARCKVRGVS
ncbi:DUF366 family protein [Desulforamulus hydrothermalis]|uniref:DUF366 domain-containing protein n=1 Tax=Desulforamulus hydrothermalis Lam5 = DSM 18033 TaxID=1121428 RepID=K8DX70_9FIRM|nr:DUF366 family protein [Desulforamulus hydrothermalis]CCO07119.1 conserved hypothetical protein [Desulforamulus hydrothermalis Lam5 = DSM 18033]SHG89710.1 hypothetical protein SAMN02745177_00753 [Desulforamulus hydrothermalis Lam5 = DSM 18033]